MAEAAEEMESKPDESDPERHCRDGGQDMAGLNHVDKRHTAEFEVVRMRSHLRVVGVGEAERNNWSESWRRSSRSYSCCRQKVGG